MAELPALAPPPPDAHQAGTGDAAASLQPGQLTQEQERRFDAHLRSVWAGELPSCPLGHKTRWGINTNFAQLPGFSGDAPMGLSGRTFPAVVMTCDVCGLMITFNAIKTGVIDEPTESEESASGEGK